MTEAKTKISDEPLPDLLGPATLSQGSQRLRETVLDEGWNYHERDLLVAESFHATEGEPFREIRVAKAIAHLMAEMPIRIREGEVLVGWHPNTRLEGERGEQVQEATRYLARENYRTFCSEGHMAPDYPTTLASGLDGVLARIDRAALALGPEEPETARKRTFYEATRIALTGFQRFIERYAELAATMAAEADDPDWADELREISRVCEHITHAPARNTREALQLSWFMFLGCALENSGHHHCFGPGRIDQWLHPYLLAERGAGDLDEALLDDLLAQYLIKCNEFSGPSMSAVILVIGGRKPDGADATNELSFKILEIADRVRTYFPGIDVSWHSDMDPEFVRQCVALLRNENGQPSFFNSDVIVKGLVRHGVAPEHAVDHLPSTCTETSIAGRCNPGVAWPYINFANCLVYALFGGVHPETGTVENFVADVGLRLSSPPEGWTAALDTLVEREPQTSVELQDAFLRVLHHVADGAIAQCNHDQYLEALHRPFPLLSCLIEGCLESGTNISEGGALYSFIQPEAVGVPNVVDALAAVRTLVDEEGRYTLDDFREASRADWEGFEEMRRAVADCPTHGNDVGWVNELFGEVAGGWCDFIEGHTNYLGGPFLPGFLGWTVWMRYGEMTPATPEGRKAGEPLANSIMNRTGATVKGFGSVTRSVTDRFDHSRGLGGIVGNVRFSADALATAKGVDALAGLIEGALDEGAYQMQVNLVSTETMRAAQENPDDYRDLLVRIGGYLVPFVLLPEAGQREVMARAELGL
jgi:formate C-acetyltransferase